jgi:8-oxo-dGTP diphosphatase
LGRPLTPLLAVDVIVEMTDRPGRPVVLVSRRNPPLGWAIPGGFVDVGESVEHAAVRELKEETGLDIVELSLFGVYSDPDRDPRGHTVSVVFTAAAAGTPLAGDDAGQVMVVLPQDTPTTVFDHAQILSDYCRTRHDRE